jgi:hypothetical protein
MLNYLGLSRRRKYRQYFYTANIILRKYVLAKALKGLKKWTADVRRFRVKRQKGVLQLCFNWMQRSGVKDKILREIMSRKEVRKNVMRLQKGFYGF